MSSDLSWFTVDIRDVFQRKIDKSYSTLGEAFEDLLSDFFLDLPEEVVLDLRNSFGRHLEF